MPERSQADRQVLVIAGVLGYLLVHGLAACLLPESFSPLSTLGVVIAELAAVSACLTVAGKTAGQSRMLWCLLALSILLHATAMSLDMIAEWQGKAATLAPALQVLLGALDGVPLLLAVSLEVGTREDLLFRIMKVILSLATGALFYVLIFAILPIHTNAQPAPLVFVSNLFDVLGIFLWIAAMIRVFGADQANERRFFVCLSMFLGSSTILDSVHNRILMKHDYVWLDLFLSASPLLLAGVIFMTSSRPLPSLYGSPRIGRIIRIGSPVFLSLALLLLGIFVSRSQFYIGTSAVVLSIGCYCAINIILHERAIEAEESLAHANRRLTELVSTDGLTGTSNRRAFDQRIGVEVRAAHRFAQPLSLLLIDVDNFKQLNDAKGHLAGDDCLVQIAQTLYRALPRATDFLARYGGEEFVVLLPATDGFGAATVAHTLHRAISNLYLEHPSSPSGLVTVSIGLSTYDGSVPPDMLGLIHTADQALYRAKRLGRTRTEVLVMGEVDKANIS
jgi:diguanylate cyclase (GGDEF)-like protein